MIREGTRTAGQQSPAEFRRNMTIIYKAGSLDEPFKITV
jgi:hypothetical protein